MKRTPMPPRKQPLKAKRTIVRRVSVSCASPRDVAVLSVKVPKASKLAPANKKPSTVYRSAPYLAFVRSIPCVWCYAAGRTQAAHSNQAIFGKGMAQKGSDAAAMALCAPAPGLRGCHAFLDQGGKLEKIERNVFEYWCICKTVMLLVLQGRLIADPEVLLTIPATVVDAEETARHLVGLIESGRLRLNTAASAARKEP